MVPGVFAADGCGEGTVLVDGVCQLAPEESNDGCGEGTVLVDGVCQLAKTSGTSMSIEPTTTPATGPSTWEPATIASVLLH
jgi:hypothetical protein